MTTNEDAFAKLRVKMAVKHGELTKTYRSRLHDVVREASATSLLASAAVSASSVAGGADWSIGRLEILRQAARSLDRSVAAALRARQRMHDNRPI